MGLDQGPVVQAMSCRCGHREEGGGEGEGKRLHLGTGEREISEQRRCSSRPRLEDVKKKF